MTGVVLVAGGSLGAIASFPGSLGSSEIRREVLNLLTCHNTVMLNYRIRRWGLRGEWGASVQQSPTKIGCDLGAVMEKAVGEEKMRASESKGGHVVHFCEL